jgi:hypothetical protein
MTMESDESCTMPSTNPLPAITSRKTKNPVAKEIIFRTAKTVPCHGLRGAGAINSIVSNLNLDTYDQ